MNDLRGMFYTVLCQYARHTYVSVATLSSCIQKRLQQTFKEREVPRKEVWENQISVTVTVTAIGLVKLYAFNVHICPSKYLVYF